MKKYLIIFIMSWLVACLSFTMADATTLTTIYNTSWGNSSPYGAEWDLYAGLSDNPANPGGDNTVNAGDILDYYYSSWTRLDDFGVLPNDQLWLDLDGGVIVKAIYTSNSLYLGYATNESTGSPITWLNGSGGGRLNAVNETASFDIVPNSDVFIWALGGAGNKYSRQSLNPGGRDYMVSFRIHGILNTPGDPIGGYTIPDHPTFVLGFEDGTDWDYQDFVVQVKKVAPVPEPGTFLLLGFGFLGLFFTGMMRRKKSNQ